MFLLVPLTPKVVTNLANLLFIASMVGIGLLLRHWRKADSQQLIKVLSALGIVTALGFQYLLAHGNFQHRVALVETWIIATAIWICIEAYRLHRVRKSFYVLALMVISAAWIAINTARLADVLSSAPTNINLYQVPVSLMIFRFVMGALQTLGLIFLIAHASERLTWRSLEIQKEKDETSTLNAELTRLMGERDHMLMINSRFSTVSSLAMFNSAIVHELSQPLTALTVMADVLTKEPEKQASAAMAARNGLAESGRRNAEVIQAMGMAERLGLMSLRLKGLGLEPLDDLGR